MYRELTVRYKPGNITFSVSDEDFDRVKAIRWHAFKRRKVFYLRGVVDGKSVLLHRFILDCPDGMTVDHIDGDPTNNRRENLRICSLSDNVAHGWSRGAYDGQKTSARSASVRSS